MQQLKKIFIILISALVVFAAGCRTSPIYNVEDQSVISGSTRASMEDVKNAILRAGAGLSWAMRENKPGYITGTLTLREHFAVVDIKYDTQKYSILYKDSKNLKYDGTNIHNNYNGWVQRLNQAIQAQLGAAPAMKGQIR
jgi:hypothetical protein